MTPGVPIVADSASDDDAWAVRAREATVCRVRTECIAVLSLRRAPVCWGAAKGPDIAAGRTGIIVIPAGSGAVSRGASTAIPGDDAPGRMYGP